MTVLNLSTCDKKYTIIQEENGAMRFLRHGVDWPAANEKFAHVGMILTLAQDLREAREVVHDLMEAFALGTEAQNDAAIKRAKEFLGE